MKNLVLIGLPGCGKTTVGQRLAAELGLAFVDCDAEIEKRAGKTIPEIFSREGEETFRELESEALFTLLNTPGKVVSAGGGIVLKKANREVLRRATVVFLDREPNNIMLTCNLAGRPLMETCALAELAAQRRQLYLDCADHIVTAESIEEITAEIVEYWREGTCVF